MRDNPLQFAVVREDPRVEMELVAVHGCRRILLVASGGCTALALQGQFPGLELTLADPNPAQIAHVRTKADRVAALHAAAAADRAARLRGFNVGSDDPAGLAECGNFESLFRGWRAFLHDLVLPAGALAEGFTGPRACERMRAALITHPYWPVAFDLYFHDRLLTTMFGPAAVQHAQPGSYPAYFRAALERLLGRPDAWTNPFLHHLLLGRYGAEPACWPEFLARPAAQHRFHYHAGPLESVEHFAAFDCIALSNVCDWMAPAAVAALLGRIRTEARAGTVVVWRQLNNIRDLTTHLAPRFAFDDAGDARRTTEERSGFYNRVRTGVRR